MLIEGHFARPNPQCRHAGPVLLIAHGPHAYVSPSWYVDKEEEARVPTWNYAVAHVRGELQMFIETDALADLVSRLSDRHEAAVGQAWRFEPDRADHREQLRGIVGFRLVPTRIDLKFKLNQNHPAANVRGVAAGLQGLSDPQAQEIAGLMLDRLARRG